MLKKFGFGIVVTAMLLGGCSSTDSDSGAFDCAGTKSKCANDPMLTQDQIGTCKQGIADPTCGSIIVTALKCARDKQVCNAAGKTDEDATEAACSAESEAVNKCVGIEAGTGGGG